MSVPVPAVLAVDGGNSKTDVLLVAADGRLLAAVRGGTTSHQAVGLEAGMARLQELVVRAATLAAGSSGAPLPGGSGPFADLGSYCLAGADTSADIRLLERGLGTLGLAARDVVRNDCFAALRAGAPEGWGVALICGQGINGAAIAPDGRTARFAGIGGLSGDWGGGLGLGQEALAAAIRGRDGRGPRTALEGAVARHFGQRTPEAVMLAMYRERLSERRLTELAPALFATAESGDLVATRIVDRLVAELAGMALALMRRLGMVRRATPTVLAGGVFATDSRRFHDGLAAAIADRAPRARLIRLEAPPVLGAALLGLDALAPDGRAPVETMDRLRAQLAATSPAAPAGRPVIATDPWSVNTTEEGVRDG